MSSKCGFEVHDWVPIKLLDTRFIRVAFRHGYLGTVNIFSMSQTSSVILWKCTNHLVAKQNLIKLQPMVRA